MKKILITTAICLIGAASMMAQGRINFANTSATGIRISANPDGSASVLLGTASTAQFGIGPASAVIQLFASANSAALAGTRPSDLSSLSPVLIGTGANLSSATNSASAVATAQGTFPGGSSLNIPGNNGTPLFFRVTAKSINGQYEGISAIIQVTPTLSPAAAATFWFAGADTANTLGGITLVPVVPEPSSMALAGLGAASLLIFRRRK